MSTDASFYTAEIGLSNASLRLRTLSPHIVVDGTFERRNAVCLRPSERKAVEFVVVMTSPGKATVDVQVRAPEWHDAYETVCTVCITSH